MLNSIPLYSIFIIFLLVSFGASFIGGTIGIGGGLIALPIYLILFNNNLEQATLYSFTGILFLTIFSVIKYFQQKTTPNLKKLIPMLGGTSIGLIISMNWIQPNLDPALKNASHTVQMIPNIILAIILIIVSALILFKDKINPIYISDMYLFPISILASILSSILGIGTSSVFLPVLLFLYGMTPKTIPVVILSITGMIASSSILERIVVLHVQPINSWIFIIIAIGSIIGAILGPIVNKKIKQNYLIYMNVAVRLFSLVLTIISML